MAMWGLLRISREPDAKGRGIPSSIVQSIANPPTPPPQALRHPLMLAYRNAKKSFPTWTNIACLSEYECQQVIYYGRIRSSAWESIKKNYLEKREKTLGPVLMDATCPNLPREEERPMQNGGEDQRGGRKSVVFSTWERTHRTFLVCSKHKSWSFKINTKMFALPFALSGLIFFKKSICFFWHSLYMLLLMK